MSTAKSLIKPVFIGVIMYAIIFAIFHPYVVSGSSMFPTYHDQNFVLSTSHFSEDTLSSGDVVIANADNNTVIKRIVAVPGDTVQIKNGYLYVNGVLSEYNYEQIDDAGCLSEEYIVSPEHFIIMGDNRNHSFDSRKYGAVSIDNIKYLVTKTLL